MKKKIKTSGGLSPDKYHTGPELISLFKYLRSKAANKTRRSEINLILLELLIGSGLRAEELLSLKIKDLPIYHNKPVIYVRCGKGSVSRAVLIDEYLTERIRRFVKLFRGRVTSGSYLLTNERGGRLSYWSLYSRLKVIGKNAGLVRLTPHSLRHDFAMQLYGVSKDLSMVQMMLGHSDIRTSTIYARTDSQEMRRQIDLLSEKFNQSIRS